MGAKTIVLTTYGKNEVIEGASISLFDRTEASSYHSSPMDNAAEYCDNINDLELKDDKWIYARIITENEKFILEKPLKFDIINRLDDLSIQKVLREIDSTELAKALKDTDEGIKEKVFKNMTKRAVAMLEEDIESLHQISNKDIKDEQRKIVAIIQHLAFIGEIVVAGC
jgi:flagellar motor switch protein FliG